MHHCGSVVVSNDDLAPEHRQPSRWQYVFVVVISWWCHQMETFSALLAICAGNSPGTQGQVTRSFNVFFDLRLNKRLIKQSWGWWFERISRALWRHCNMCGFTVVHSRMPQIIPLGSGKLKIFSVPLLSHFQNCQNTDYLYDSTFIFYRCHHSSAVETPDKYERGLKYLTC